MTKRFEIATIIFLVLSIGTVAYVLINNTNTINNLSTNQNMGKITKLDNGLEIEILTEGKGEELKSGQNAVVHYTGTLTNGTKFDSSKDRNQPFEVENVGQAQVIEGWNIGLIGMKVGEKRKLTIPPSLGYGAEAVSTIPANSTLLFEVELLEIK